MEQRHAEPFSNPSPPQTIQQLQELQAGCSSELSSILSDVHPRKPLDIRVVLCTSNCLKRTDARNR